MRTLQKIFGFLWNDAMIIVLYYCIIMIKCLHSKATKQQYDRFPKLFGNPKE